MYKRESTTTPDTVWSDNRTILGPAFLMLLIPIVLAVLAVVR